MAKIPAVPLREKPLDEKGYFVRPWIHYFETKNTATPEAAGTASDPAAPTLPTIAVVDGGQSFGLKVSWTVPANTGGTTGYEVQVRYYHDAGLVTADSDWMGIGIALGADIASYENGKWPRPAVDQWVIGRVRALNADNTVTAWVSTAAAVKIDKATGVVVPAANAPTSASISVTGDTQAFSVNLAWTLPGSTGGTQGYELQVRYYHDPGLTVADSDWMGVGMAMGASVNASTNGPYPRPAADQWVLGRVRAIAADNSASTWATTPLAAKVDMRVSGDGPTPPTRLTGANWAVTVAEYGHDNQTGKNVARLQAVVTVNLAGVRYYSIYSCTADSPPADLTLYRDVCDTAQASVGNTTLTWWVDRDAVNPLTMQLICVPSSSEYTMFPDGTDAVKSVVVAQASVPAQVTGFAVTPVYGETGVHFKCDWTPPADLEYYTNNVYLIKCDSGGTPLPGWTWGKVAFSSVNSFEQSDWFAYPPEKEYWLAKSQAASRAGLENTTAPPTVLFSISPKGAQDNTNQFLNADLSRDLQSWTQWDAAKPVTVQVAGHTGPGSKAIVVNQAGSGVYQEFPAAAGDQFQLSASMYEWSTPTPGTIVLAIRWYNETGLLSEVLHSVTAASLHSTWTTVSSKIETAPAWTSRVRACIYTGAAYGGGGLLTFDQPSFRRMPVAAMLAAGSDMVWDSTNHKAILADAAVTLAKIKPGDLNSSIFADYGISNPTKLADGIISRVGLFADGVISRSAIFGTAVILTAHIGDLQVTDAKINALSVNKLTAGSAMFSGDVSFTRTGSGGSMVLGSTGITLQKDGSVNQVSISASGITLTGGTSGSISQAILSSTSLTLSAGGSTATLDSNGLHSTSVGCSVLTLGAAYKLDASSGTLLMTDGYNRQILSIDFYGNITIGNGTNPVRIRNGSFTA